MVQERGEPSAFSFQRFSFLLLALALASTVSAQTPVPDPSNPQSAIRDPQSSDSSNPQSAIRNPQSPDPDALPILDPSSSDSSATNPQLQDPVKKLWEVPVPEPVTSPPDADLPTDHPTSDFRLPTSAPHPAPTSGDFRNDPIARTAMYNAQSNAAAFTNGVGGFGSLADSAFLPAFVNTKGEGFVFGPATLHHRPELRRQLRT